MPRRAGEETSKQDQEPTRTGNDENDEFRIDDRRHWAAAEDRAEATDEAVEPTRPTVIDEYRIRAEGAERKLQEYIEAFKQFKDDQEDFRVRLNRDVERKVQLQFSGLLEEFLGCVDDLDLALSHAGSIPEARPLAEGVGLARKRFLDALERHGVVKVTLDDTPFDPNEAEAIRIDAVSSADLDGRVTETLRPGYRLGERIIRAARVAVGRFSRSEP